LWLAHGLLWRTASISWRHTGVADLNQQQHVQLTLHSTDALLRGTAWLGTLHVSQSGTPGDRPPTHLDAAQVEGSPLPAEQAGVQGVHAGVPHKHPDRRLPAPEYHPLLEGPVQRPAWKRAHQSVSLSGCQAGNAATRCCKDVKAARGQLRM
jgi:hypothetical protein